MAPEKRQNVLDWAASGLRAILPIIAIGWYAQGAVSRIEAKATEAVDQVRAAVAEVRLAEATHEAADNQRQAETDRRLGHVENRQDTIEAVLARLGLAAINEDRRPRLRSEPR